MATSGNDRLLFLHVPKTGGNWVVAAMKAAGVELQPEGSIHAALDTVAPDGRFSFAFVREPLSWYGSWWQHCRVVHPMHRVQAFFNIWPPDLFINLPFEQYLQGCMTWSPRFLSRYYRLYLGRPETPVGFAGHYERLADDLVLALQMANQDFDEEALRAFPPANVGGPMPACSPELRDRLMVVERESYERFYGSNPGEKVLGNAGVQLLSRAKTPGPG